MLNELLRNRVKTSISNNNNAMMTIDIATMSNDVIPDTAYDCLNNQSQMNQISGNPLHNNNESGDSTSTNDMAQHMLRNILQGVGNKKDLYTLQCELHEASNNNNIIINNNNKNKSSEIELNIHCTDNVNMSKKKINNKRRQNNNLEIKSDDEENHNNEKDEGNDDNDNDDDNDDDEDNEDDNAVNNSIIENPNQKDLGDIAILTKKEKIDDFNYNQMNRRTENISLLKNIGKFDSDHHYNNGSDNNNDDFEHSISSPESLSNNSNKNNNDKDNLDKSMKELVLFQKSEQKELKRNRVENIISGIHSNPILSSVNGCKKRKLYHPQQHDNNTNKRFINSTVVNNISEDEDETSYLFEEHRNVMEKNILKTQLQTVQEQLAQIQEKYTQLCANMEKDAPEVEEVINNIDQDEEPNITTPDKNITPNSKINNNTSSVVDHKPLSSSLPKKSSKLPPQNMNMPPLYPPSFTLHPNFHNTLSFLQQQLLQEQNFNLNSVPNHLQPPHHYLYRQPQVQPPFNNIATMYSGVNKKLFKEQKTKLVKDIMQPTKHYMHYYPPQLRHPQSQQMQPNIQLPAKELTNCSKKLMEKEQYSAELNKNNQSSKVQIDTSPLSSVSSVLSTLSQPLELAKNNVEHTTMIPGTTIKSSKSKFENNPLLLSSHGDIEGLADSLKHEITTSLSNLIDTIMNQFLQQKCIAYKTSDEQQTTKELSLSPQFLECKSPCVKNNEHKNPYSTSSNKNLSSVENLSHSPTTIKEHLHNVSHTPVSTIENNMNISNLVSTMETVNTDSNPYSLPKVNSINNSLYSSISTSRVSPLSPFCLPDMRIDATSTVPEQNEALSLVVAPKKKRHKVTDTRITPKTVNRILAQDSITCPTQTQPLSLMDTSNKCNRIAVANGNLPDSPPPSHTFHVPSTAPMLPVSLPTSVAIPNPSLHESQVFSPYNLFYGQHPLPQHQQPSRPPSLSDDLQDSPPMQQHHAGLFHPTILAAAHHQQQHEQSIHKHGTSSPDFMNLLPNSGPSGDNLDPGSECNSTELEGNLSISSTLSPIHLRKAKLMFFWVRYPTSQMLKAYFPDIKFSKNITAQLVKWFSNFREFYYSQIEKFARSSISDGVTNADDLYVSVDSEVYKALNAHYNRSNHIEIPNNFRYVVEQTLKEFFKAIQIGKDQDQSWKKPIYKVIGRLDDPVPEYFKTPNFLEQLE